MTDTLKEKLGRCEKVKRAHSAARARSENTLKHPHVNLLKQTGLSGNTAPSPQRHPFLDFLLSNPL